MWKEFKEFAMKGNVIDLAIGVVIGGAFGKIVTSLVNDIIMPVVGSLVGKVDFSNLYIDLSGQQFNSLQEAQAAGAATINYGLFLNNLINFLIIAFSIFIVIKQINKLKNFTMKKEEVKVEATEKDCPYCCTKIDIKATRCPHCTSVLEEATN
ncbi:large conductance mechanosensitive channel protein MscL [Clostridium perfringens]|uniref:large conductance mechanosensitive channel protein MscL n=1 Tax=Clostridium perfringens TaxID=1502 RepID=UPI0004265C30|nr:large conductance mechanosensitive channel protein MscL [Clostridium perfringens]MBI6057266.1 large conductance mechanosensitive channel protein MscL [Clostridium perfringens]MBO3342027.1 large conductance mechanosensitive channel protein MscL [Clostridium perfringens]MDK0668399.1 large conductance mechanosensitive channel protein MscL [Clostridium perfringens]MDK0844302.1 large conductance mechanosensitive channel protein MscL [Clostridium perfringens]MDM0801225.1 large conductance mechano